MSTCGLWRDSKRFGALAAGDKIQEYLPNKSMKKLVAKENGETYQLYTLYHRKIIVLDDVLYVNYGVIHFADGSKMNCPRLISDRLEEAERWLKERREGLAAKANERRKARMLKQAAAFDELSDRPKRIFELRQGGKCFDEIGKIFEISRERARQIYLIAKHAHEVQLLAKSTAETEQ